MKKTQKRIVGILSLALVVAMTIFAALLPTPGASALSGVTDTVILTIVYDIPFVQIQGPSSGDTIASLDEPISIKFDNLKNYKLTATYVRSDGTEEEPFEIATVNDPEAHGEMTYSFKDVGLKYGYGRYVIKLTGEGLDGSATEDSAEFVFAAMNSEVEEDEETGGIYVDFEYDNNAPGLADDGKIDTIVLNVYDKDGKIIPGLSPITVKAPAKQVEIPFDDPDLNLPSGKYTIVIQAYNSDGNPLYLEQILTVDYERTEVPSTAVPDTGGMLKNLNISRADYLITGIAVFSIVGIGGIIFINKRSRESQRKRK